MEVKPMWKHQKEGIERALQYSEFAFLFEAGTGKTRTCLEVLRSRFNQHGRLLRTLILAPKVVCENWRNEFKEWTKIPPNRVCVLSGSGKERVETMMHIYADKELGHVVVANYQTLLMKDVFKVLEMWNPEVLVFDESHRLKNHKAVTTKQATVLADKSLYRYILTGTPILQSLLDVFSQWRVLDKGNAFGKNFYQYQRLYFYDKNAGKPWATWKEWVVREHADSQIQDLLSKRSMFVRKSECLDLPPFVRKTIHVEMGTDQAKHYKEMEKNLVTFLGDKACTAQLAITKALRLQQIVSGFVKVEGQDDPIPFKDVPRLDALKELLEDLKDEVPKIIIWACWRENYHQIREVCAGLKIGYVELHGECTDTQRKTALEDFSNNPDVKVLIGNQGAAGIGINLVEAPVAIYYSRNFSLEHDIQSEARNYRGGSERHQSVTRIDLVSKETIDEKVLEALEKKQDIGNRVLGFLHEAYKT